MEGIVIIISIFKPVDDGVVDRNSLPYSRQGKLSIQRLVPVKCFIIIARSPVLEFITRAGRVARLDRAGRITGLNKERLLIAAASAIKLDPVAGFDLGIEGDIRTFQRDRLDLMSTALIGIPAGNGLLRSHCEGSVRLNDGVLCALAGFDDAASGINEEDVIHLLELGGIGYFRVCGHSNRLADGRGFLAIEPTHELVARLLFRRGGGHHGFAIADILLSDDVITILILEDGMERSLIRSYR